MSEEVQGIEGNIIRVLKEKQSSVTFPDLYAELSQFSEQGIRNTVYSMIEKGLVKRIPSLQVVGRKMKRPKSRFILSDHM